MSILSELVDPSHAEKLSRMRKAENDFPFFCRHYLGDYFFSEFSEYQKIILAIIGAGEMTREHIKQLKPYMNDADHKALAPAASIRALVDVEPRGHGKTTRMSFAYPLWRLLYKKSRYTVMFGASATAAAEMVEAVKNELESNEAILEDFGAMQTGESWSNRKLILANGTALQGFGAGTSVRGTKYRQYRPDTAIVDDLLSDQDADSRAVRNSRYRWFRRAVIPLGKHMTIIMTNTIMHDDDVVSRVMARISKGELPNWIALRFAALIGASLERAKPLWPDYWSRAELLAKRDEVGSRAFYTEYQNSPLSPEEAIFNAEWIRGISAGLDTKHMKVYMAVDPSAGAHDRSAIVAVGVLADGARVVLDCWARRCSPNALIAAIIDMHNRYAPVKIGFEATAFQAIYKKYIMEKARAVGVRLPMVEVSPRGRTKHARIERLSPHIENGLYVFNTARCGMLIDELTMYPKHEYDDLIDALAYADELADGRVSAAPRVFRGRERPIKKLFRRSTI